MKLSALRSPQVVLALVMLVNALAYGTIIPLLYPYAARFGLSPVGLSWLFVSFSVAQFLATPIIGRLSDRFGRRPLLLLCLAGTGLSLVLFASAWNLTILFVARIVDGITGGNISVAQAVIADTTEGNDRAKAFGMLGAAFGFGFLLGPAIGGILSQWGLAAPFYFAAALAFVGVGLGMWLLPETLKTEVKQPKEQPLFNPKALFSALFSPVIGIVLLLNFLIMVAQNAFIIGFQSFTVDVLLLNTTQVGLIFTGVGLISIFMQVSGVRWLLKLLKSKKRVVLASSVVATVCLVILWQLHQVQFFLAAMSVYLMAMSATSPMLTGLLSERTKAEDQGGVLGINQSYTSLGQIAGPVLAGLIAASRPVSDVFGLAALVFALAVVASRWLFVPHPNQADI